VKVFLVGEAARHRDDLAAHLDAGPELVELPPEAAHDGRHDARIGPDDVLVSLRLDRQGGPLPPVALLHVPGAGLDGIDLDRRDPATAVCNVYEHEIPIAEYTLACLLEHAIGTTALRARMATEPWSQVYRSRQPHGELHSRRLLLVGYGRIGRAIAARAAAFGLHVRAVDDYAASDGHALVVPTTALHDELGAADYVVVACPLTDTTRGLIGGPELAVMPAHAVLVNPSRGPIVDEQALYDALRDHRIAGAFLDVWYRYPGPDGEPDAPSTLPLATLPNVWATPHSSAWTYELSQRRYAVVADNINRLRDGRPLRNLVAGPAALARE